MVPLSGKEGEISTGLTKTDKEYKTINLVKRGCTTNPSAAENNSEGRITGRMEGSYNLSNPEDKPRQDCND